MRTVIANLVINFVLFSGETVQELPVGVGASLATQCLGNLVPFESLEPFFLLCFLTHRDPEVKLRSQIKVLLVQVMKDEVPCISDHYIGTLNCFSRIRAPPDTGITTKF